MSKLDNLIWNDFIEHKSNDLGFTSYFIPTEYYLSSKVPNHVKLAWKKRKR